MTNLKSYLSLSFTKSIVFVLSYCSFNLFGAPIILPNAPGVDSIQIDEQKAIAIADTSYNSYDVRFLQMMIIHHEQALVMSRLAPLRTNSKNILDLAGRIETSQEDEMLFMKSWLKERGESINYKHDHRTMKMAGMASPEEIHELKNTNSVEFDRFFLELMILKI